MLVQEMIFVFFFCIQIYVNSSGLFFNPARILERTVILPIILDTDICVLLLLTNPLVQHFVAAFLQHNLFQVLIVIGNGSLVSRRTALQFHNHTLFFPVFCGIMVKASEISPTFILSTTLAISGGSSCISKREVFVLGFGNKP